MKPPLCRICTAALVYFGVVDTMKVHFCPDCGTPRGTKMDVTDQFTDDESVVCRWLQQRKINMRDLISNTGLSEIRIKGVFGELSRNHGLRVASEYEGADMLYFLQCGTRH